MAFPWKISWSSSPSWAILNTLLINKVFWESLLHDNRQTKIWCRPYMYSREEKTFMNVLFGTVRYPVKMWLRYCCGTLHVLCYERASSVQVWWKVWYNLVIVWSWFIEKFLQLLPSNITWYRRTHVFSSLLKLNEDECRDVVTYSIMKER